MRNSDFRVIVVNLGVRIPCVGYGALLDQRHSILVANFGVYEMFHSIFDTFFHAGMLRTALKLSGGASLLCRGDVIMKDSGHLKDQFLTFKRMKSFKNKFYWKPSKKRPNLNPKFPVILLEDDENLGRKFEVVKVERGYARHVLIPEGKADYAIEENLEKYGCLENSSKPRASLKFLNKLKSMHLIMPRPSEESWEISKHHIAHAFKSDYKLHVPVHCMQTDFEAISEFGNYQVYVTVNGESTVPVDLTVKEWEPIYKDDWKDILFGEPEVEQVEYDDI